MRLAELEPVRRGHRCKFVARIDDEHELTVAGPQDLVEEMLQEAEIEVKIVPEASLETWGKEQSDALELQRTASAALARLDDLEGFWKEPPPALGPDTTVAAAIRRVKGDGTPFVVSVSAFFVPRGVSFVFLGSLVFATTATVFPVSGDQDLLLHLFSPATPAIAGSVLPGVLPDVVAFALPFPFPFVPAFRVFGFLPGVCGRFFAFGA